MGLERLLGVPAKDTDLVPRNRTSNTSFCFLRHLHCHGHTHTIHTHTKRCSLENIMSLTGKAL